MEHIVFPPKWLQWIRSIFQSSTSAVLLNGVPRKIFHCKRGVRQGDPLSPLLFVLATDFIQKILNNARINHLLSLPVTLPSDEDFSILQYADDTLIFMKGDINELNNLKDILSSFAESTSLGVNFDKSMMVPIYVLQKDWRSYSCQLWMVKGLPTLSEAGRLELTDAVITALPTFAMCNFLLPKTVIKHLDKYRKHCLWRGRFRS